MYLARDDYRARPIMDVPPFLAGFRTATRVRARSGMSLAAFAAVLAALMLASYDRYLVLALVDPIKQSIGASDLQIGLIVGVGFALVYAVAALPIAHWADRGHRRGVLIGSVLFWTAMTALGGAAGSVGMLLATRVGVGLGEAGLAPVAQALVADHMPVHRRTTFLSLTIAAASMGLALAGGLGGWIAEHWGWRMAFLAGAIPGPFLALLMATVLPPQVHAQVAGNATALVPAILALIRIDRFRLLCCGHALSSVASFAVLAWAPSVLTRTFHLSAGAGGAGFGLVFGGGMTLGLLAGGPLGDWLHRRGEHWPMMLIVTCMTASLPVTLAFLCAPGIAAMLAIALPMSVLAVLGSSSAYAMVQSLAGPDRRAKAAALFQLSINLVGMGLGPSLAGLLSDLGQPHFGEASLRLSLSLLSLLYLAGAALTVAAMRHEPIKATSGTG